MIIKLCMKHDKWAIRVKRAKFEEREIITQWGHQRTFCRKVGIWHRPREQKGSGHKIRGAILDTGCAKLQVQISQSTGDSRWYERKQSIFSTEQ